MRRLFFLALCLSISLSAGADVFYLNAGEELVGTIEKMASDAVTLREITGEHKTISQSEISHILLSKVRQGDEINTVASLTDPFLLEILKKAPEASEYPDSELITLHRSSTFTFHSDRSVIHQQRLIVKVLKEGGMGVANQALYFHPDRETRELVFAHTYAPDGHVYHVTDEAVSEENIFSATPEYDNLKKIKFAMKKASIGSVLDISTRSVTKGIDALHPFYIDTVFGEREPVLHDEMIVSHPVDIPLTIEKSNWHAIGKMVIRESLQRSGDVEILTFQYSDKKGFIPEQGMAPVSRLFPRLTIIPTQSWDDLSAAFAAGIASAAPSPARLQEFIKSTNVATAATSLEKATILYDAILRQIKVLGITFGETGEWKPVSGEVTLTKKYGNNISRLVLLHHLLKSQGIDSAVGLSSSWVIEGMNPRFPTLGQCGDIYLRIMSESVPAYAWCGSDYMPFGQLPTWYQGSTGAWLNNGRFVFEKLPEGGAEKNRIDRQIHVKLEAGGDMVVNETRQARGAFEDTLRVLRASRDKELDIFAQRSVKKIHPKAELLHYGLSNLADLQAPAVYTLSYRIPQAAIKASDRLLAFKNFWVHYNSGSASLATRTFPMTYSPTEETTHSITVELPEGFDWVPWNRSFNHVCSCLSYVAGIRQLGRLLVFSDIFRVTSKWYNPGETYQHYRSCLTRMTDLANQWIILEKVDMPKP